MNLESTWLSRRSFLELHDDKITHASAFFDSIAFSDPWRFAHPTSWA